MESRTEYREIVCADGKGYLLRTAQAGGTGPTVVMSCTGALAANGVKCESTKSRAIGQENVRKCNVVECAGPEPP